jgi:hypothetical protein
VIVDEQGDIYGDGVNIATRVESLARPGAICLSDEAYRHGTQWWLREATGRAPNHQYGHAFLAATYAQLGQLVDARAEAAEVVRVNPKYTIGAQKLVSILKRGDDSDHLIDGLRKAGLPE